MFSDAEIYIGAAVYLIIILVLMKCFFSQKEFERKERKELEDFNLLKQRNHEKDI